MRDVIEQDEEFMRAALAAAARAAAVGDVPVGAVVVLGDAATGGARARCT